MKVSESSPGEAAVPTGPARCATGLQGFDEITSGGLPANRTTLVLGGPGCGKTVFGLSFIKHGCDIGERGVYVSLEQSCADIAADARSVGVDVPTLVRELKLVVLPLAPARQDFVEAGSFTLDGLLAAVVRAADEIDARRIVIDQVDGLFAHFRDARTLRFEFRRLAQELSSRGLSTLMIGSAAGGRHRLEEFLSDCVVHLDHRVEDQISTRRLRVMKYRGTQHGTDEYPFVITPTGPLVFPITSSTLDYDVTQEIASTGIGDLDALLGGGYYRGSALLLAGQTGTGKTTLACQIAAAAAQAGQRCAYFSLEESPQQLRRNARSVGIDLDEVAATGRLEFHAFRPSVQGLEQHLVLLLDRALRTRADLVVVDPFTNLVAVGSGIQVKAMLTRLIDGFRKERVTTVMTSLIALGDMSSGADIGVSSLMDTLLLIEHRVTARMRRGRFLSVLKARGLPSCQEIRELLLSRHGIALGLPRDFADRGAG